MKLIWGLIKFFIFLIILAFVLKNFAMKWIASGVLGSQLGTKVKVGDVRMDLVNTQVKFEDLRIQNPMEFPDGTLASIPKLFIDWKPSALLKGKIGFHTIELNIEEMSIMNIRGSGLNLYALKIFRKDAEQDKTSRRTESREKPGIPNFQIDQLVLTLGKATFTDLTGTNPVQKSAQLGVDHAVYRNVEGLGGIAGIVAWESLKRMGLGGFLDALRGFGFQENAMESVGQFFGDLMNRVKEGLGS